MVTKVKTNLGMAHGDRKPKSCYNGRLAADPCKAKLKGMQYSGRFIDYPVREYPIKLLERGSTLSLEMRIMK